MMGGVLTDVTGLLDFTWGDLAASCFVTLARAPSVFGNDDLAQKHAPRLQKGLPVAGAFGSRSLVRRRLLGRRRRHASAGLS